MKIKNLNLLFFVGLTLLCLGCDDLSRMKIDKKKNAFGELMAGNWQIDKVVYEYKDGNLKDNPLQGSIYFDKFTAPTEAKASYSIRIDNATTNFTDDFKFVLYYSSTPNYYPAGTSFYSFSIATPPKFSNGSGLSKFDIVRNSDIVLDSNKMILYTNKSFYSTAQERDSTVYALHLSR